MPDPQEARHGLNLMGCVDVTVEGLRIEHTGGDGISVWTGHRYNGRKYPAPPPPGACVGNADCACEKVLIRDVVCDSNYRAPSPFGPLSTPSRSVMVLALRSSLWRRVNDSCAQGKGCR